MTIITKYAEAVEEKLQNIPFKTEPASLYGPCRYVLGNSGKRFRPVLTMIAAGLCSGNTDKSLPAALAIELIHNFTLVHDDIMDGADSRRGKPSVHSMWDMPTAILTGDMLYAEAFDQLAVYGSDPEISKAQFAQLYETLVHSIRVVCEGQAMDMNLEKSDHVTTDDYLNMIRDKTSALIGGSLVMGGIVASADDETLELLRSLGTFIGLAFQIQDDLMDVVADPEKFGKTPNGDIREGKKTFLLTHALEQSNEINKRELHRLIKLKQMSESDVGDVVRLYADSGAIESAERSVRHYYRKAVEVVNQFDDSIYKEDLVSLLNFLNKREY